MVINENTPPNGSAFLTESPYEAPTMPIQPPATRNAIP
jgi:hypothetical protein